MLGQINIYGLDKVEQAIKRLQTFEPEEGYYLAFSGGKDSVVIKALADMAGVKYDAHYNVTSVDPPKLVYFIREKYPDVSIDIPHDKEGNRVSMWSLIPKHLMPPTRIVRYCCKYLKESSGEGRFTVTGVRWAESAKRKKWGGVEFENGKGKNRECADPDNPTQEVIHFCLQHSKRVLNPIIDWMDDDVWEFIKKYNIPYCKLYDEGCKRLGCIGCPMSIHQAEELDKYPKYKNLYIKAFDKMLEERKKRGKLDDGWKTGEDVYKWWIGEDKVIKGEKNE